MSFRRNSTIFEPHVGVSMAYGLGRKNSLRYKNKFYATTAPRRHSIQICGQPPPAFMLLPKRRVSSFSEDDTVTEEETTVDKMHFDKEVHDLMIAVQNHNEVRVRQILLIHTQIAPVICTVAINNMTPLHLAAWNGSVDITRIMLQTGADANAETQGKVSLHYSAMTEMEFSPRSTPLHFASAKGYEEEVGALVDFGSDVNKCDADGNSPMQKATVMGHIDVVKILIQSKALVNAEDSYKQTVLHWAVYRKHMDIAQLLLRNGADPNHVSQNGRTPLHTAARRCYSQAVRELLENGADMNAQDSQGQTPLHLATLEWVETGKGAETVGLLVECGSDLSVYDSQSKTAQDYAGDRDLTNVLAGKAKKNSRLSSIALETGVKQKNKKTDKNGCIIL